jgi:hypothetical protein
MGFPCSHTDNLLFTTIHYIFCGFFNLIYFMFHPSTVNNEQSIYVVNNKI